MNAIRVMPISKKSENHFFREKIRGFLVIILTFVDEVPLGALEESCLHLGQLEVLGEIARAGTL